MGGGRRFVDSLPPCSASITYRGGGGTGFPVLYAMREIGKVGGGV